MASLSISKAWEEGTRFTGREFGLIYPIALLLIELPVLVMFLLMPAPPAPPADSVRLASFQDVIDLFGGPGLVLLLVCVSFLAFIVQTLGGLAITWLALRPGTRIADSLAQAGRRLLPMLGAIILIGIGFALLMLPLWLIASSVQPSTRVAPGTALGVVLLGFLTIILMLALVPRLAVMTPVAVAEKQGPLGIILRSWRLTKGHFWRLLGAFVLIGLVFMIVAMVLGLVFATVTALLVGPPETNFTAAFVFELLYSLFMAAYTAFILSFVARIYAQLAEGEADPV